MEEEGIRGLQVNCGSSGIMKQRVNNGALLIGNLVQI